MPEAFTFTNDALECAINKRAPVTGLRLYVVIV